MDICICVCLDKGMYVCVIFACRYGRMVGKMNRYLTGLLGWKARWMGGLMFGYMCVYVCMDVHIYI